MASAAYEHRGLDEKTDEVRERNRERNDQTREIHLAEKLGVGRERAGRQLQCLSVIVPGQQAAEIK